jgi:hypothetical protein
METSKGISRKIKKGIIMTKQTAVNFLMSNLLDFIHTEHHSEIVEYYEQAKEMEKQQIIDARNDMQKSCIELANKINPHLFEFNKKDGEQYFNETFNK